MHSQGILPSDSTESTTKKGTRGIHILGFIELIFISICLLLLSLNQYLNTVVDDYSPAYESRLPNEHYNGNKKVGPKEFNYLTTIISQETTDQIYQVNNSTKISSTMQSQEEETQKVFLSTTHSLPTNPTTDTTIISNTSDIIETVGNDTARIFNNHSNTNNNSNLDTDEGGVEGSKTKKSVLNDFKTKIAGKHLKSDETIMESAMKNPPDHSETAMNLKSKPKEGWTDLFVSNLSPTNTKFKVKRSNNVLGKSNDIKTKLSSLLIMYPCCVSAMMILLMQMISRYTNDIMLKSTMITLISTCIGLGVAIFATSIIESLGQRNSITILIAVGSGIFIILEIIDFILLFSIM